MGKSNCGTVDNRKTTNKQCDIHDVMCSVCKGTGKIKYKEIEVLMYSWQPWKTKDCSCKNYR